MIKIVFHKSLLPYTENIREISIERDTYYSTARNIANLFPKLESVCKRQVFSKKDDLVFIVNGKPITKDEFFLLASSKYTVYVVPAFFGGEPISTSAIIFAAISAAFTTITSLMQGYSFGDALLRGLVSGAFSLAGSFVTASLGLPGITALSSISMQAVASIAVSATFAALSMVVQNVLTGPPPNKLKSDSPDSGGRRDNDSFSNIVNTIYQGEVLALNYGMLRVGGHVISSDYETLTDQRIPDPVTEIESGQDGSGEMGGNGGGSPTDVPDNNISPVDPNQFGGANIGADIQGTTSGSNGADGRSSGGAGGGYEGGSDGSDGSW